MRTSPALASVYMTSSLRPSSAHPVCTRLFGLKCIWGRLLRTLRMSATVTRLSRILLWAWGVGVIFMASLYRAGKPRRMPCPVGVLLAEVPYLVCRGHPDVLTCTLRKVVNHALEICLS